MSNSVVTKRITISWGVIASPYVPKSKPRQCITAAATPLLLSQIHKIFHCFPLFPQLLAFFFFSFLLFIFFLREPFGKQTQTSDFSCQHLSL